MSAASSLLSVDLRRDGVIENGVTDVLHSCSISEVSLYILYTLAYLIFAARGGGIHCY